MNRRHASSANRRYGHSVNNSGSSRRWSAVRVCLWWRGLLPRCRWISVESAPDYALRLIRLFSCRSTPDKVLLPGHVEDLTFTERRGDANLGLSFCPYRFLIGMQMSISDSGSPICGCRITLSASGEGNRSGTWKNSWGSF